jgi:predicted nucleotide-binding protein (sugar kinase/HSP70/actin superfamily)
MSSREGLASPGASRKVVFLRQADAPVARTRVVAPPVRTPEGHEPYRAYKPRAFTRAERDQVTLLFGGLHWRVERLMQGSLENLGYRARILPTATRSDLLTGREVADIGQCCPTSFTTGNLANFLRDESRRSSPEAVARDFVYVTAGSCGACRFGQYHQSYELALRNVGLESFRMFLFGQGNLDQGEAGGGGLELDLPFMLGALWAIVIADVVTDLEYRTRPYEKNPGETDRVSREAIESLYAAFRDRPRQRTKWGTGLWYLGTGYFVRALAEVKSRFDAIEVDRLRVKPLVKITGEFYLQTVEGEPNYNIHRWLESEGAEVYPAAITVWFDYLLRLAAQDFEDHAGLRRGARTKAKVVHAMQRMLRWTHERMRRALGGVPRPLPVQEDLRELAAPYFHSRLNGGEGDMLVGKALWAHLNHKAHMTCELSPYSCMPNTMSVGAMAAVTGKYPDLLYAPLEIKGDAEVHALSRCQMVLTEARKRAQREFDETLARTGLDATALTKAYAAHPDLGRATFELPHHGVAGTAANVAMHLAGKAP